MSSHRISVLRIRGYDEQDCAEAEEMDASCLNAELELRLVHIVPMVILTLIRKMNVEMKVVS